MVAGGAGRGSWAFSVVLRGNWRRPSELPGRIMKRREGGFRQEPLAGKRLSVYENPSSCRIRFIRSAESSRS